MVPRTSLSPLVMVSIQWCETRAFQLGICLRIISGVGGNDLVLESGIKSCSPQQVHGMHHHTPPFLQTTNRIFRCTLLFIQLIPFVTVECPDQNTAEERPIGKANVAPTKPTHVLCVSLTNVSRASKTSKKVRRNPSHGLHGQEWAGSKSYSQDLKLTNFCLPLKLDCLKGEVQNPAASTSMKLISIQINYYSSVQCIKTSYEYLIRRITPTRKKK